MPRRLVVCRLDRAGTGQPTVLQEGVKQEGSAHLSEIIVIPSSGATTWKAAEATPRPASPATAAAAAALRTIFPSTLDGAVRGEEAQELPGSAPVGSSGVSVFLFPYLARKTQILLLVRKRK